MDINEKLKKHAMWLNGDLHGEKADLSKADLRGADLRGADLSLADLRGANLNCVDLSAASLRGVDLRGVDLRGANLNYADLRGAVGDFSIGSFGRHYAVAAGGYISIGCERHTYQEWLKNGEAIGRKNDYSDNEIARYMEWIRAVVAWLEGVDAE